MKIICANSVSLGQEAFGPLGELVWIAEGEITPEVVRDADAVVTRSKTRLDASLLGHSQVRFAGTCTAGVDHARPDELAACGIHFASAPGCNANAVSEYVLAGLLEDPEFVFAGKTVGIIGHGQVGSRVANKLRALGCEILLNDPPKAEIEGMEGYVGLGEILEKSDVITLHVPLVEEGPTPTRNLLGPAEIDRMKSGVKFFNACRGEVVDGPALIAARQHGRISQLVLDVWDPEPELPPAVLAAADLGTPHIAGHSVEGKVNGTRQILEQLVAHFDLQVPEWDPQPLMPQPLSPVVDVSAGEIFEERLRIAVRACYEIRMDDRLLREETLPMKERFVQQRRNYRDRREFSATRVTGVPESEAEIFGALGFQR